MKKLLFFIMFIAVMASNIAKSMKPNPEHTPIKFQALRITLRSMIDALPNIQMVRAEDRAAFDQKLREISLFIQSTLIDPGNEIANMIAIKGLGGPLYDIARSNNHPATLNWLVQSWLVSFNIVIKNDSEYEIEVAGLRILPTKISPNITINPLNLPMIFQGYGTFWGKSVQTRRLEKDELAKEIATLKLPRTAVIKISITLTGKIPPYTVELSFSNLHRKEAAEKNHLETKDPLDVFALLKHHGLTESSKHVMGSNLTSEEILSWPDVTQAHDPRLNEVVITKLAGRYTKRDIYRYILNLTKDNYTIQDIQKSFDQLVKEMGTKYVPGWSEQLASQGLVAGPFSWLGMLTKTPINKDAVISVALKLLKKAYQNLMVDKGEKVGE